MKVFFLLGFLLLARAQEFGEMPNEYIVSNENTEYDVADNDLEDDGTWLAQNVNQLMGTLSDSTIEMTAGPCVDNGHHQNVKLQGTSTMTAMSVFVTMYPGDEEREEVFEIGLFGEEDIAISQSANVPGPVLAVDPNPVIYVQTEGGHEKRLGTCAQLSQPVSYLTNQLRDISSNHVDYYAEIDIDVDLNDDGSLSVRGTSKRHAKQARVHFKHSQQHGYARNVDGEIIGQSMHSLAPETTNTFNYTTSSQFSSNPPFEVFFGYYDLMTEEERAELALTADVEEEEEEVSTTSVATVTSASNEAPSTAEFDRPTFYFGIERRGRGRRCAGNGTPNCKRRGKPNRNRNGKGKNNCNKPNCNGNNGGNKRVRNRQSNCKPRSMGRCPGSNANPPNSIMG